MKEWIEFASKNPSFWLNYRFMNPATKQVEPKQKYCERLNETAVCGRVYRIGRHVQVRSSTWLE